MIDIVLDERAAVRFQGPRENVLTWLRYMTPLMSAKPRWVFVDGSNSIISVSDYLSKSES